MSQQGSLEIGGGAGPQSERTLEFPARVIAMLLNVTERRVRQLVAEGVIPRARRGKYPLIGSVQGYVKYLQDLKEGTEDRAQAATRLTQVRADREELALEIRRKTLLPSEDVDQALMEVAVIFATALDGASARIAGELAGGAAMRNKLSDAFTEIRTDIADRLAVFSSQLAEDGWDRPAARKRRTRRVGKKKGPATRKRRARKVQT